MPEVQKKCSCIPVLVNVYYFAIFITQLNAVNNKALKSPQNGYFSMNNLVKSNQPPVKLSVSSNKYCYI